MPFPSTTARVAYSGDGSTVEFSVTFPFQANADLAVVLTTAGVDTTQTLNTHYAVGGAGQDSGGTVRFTTAPASGTTVTIFRDIDLNQERSFTYNGAFPTTTVALAVDKAMQAAQQLNEKLKRTFRLPETAAEIAPLTVAQRAGKIPGFDSTGLPAMYEPEIAVLPNGAAYDVPTIAALKAINTATVPANKQIAVGGYYSSGDGGGGVFYFNSSSSATDNGGTIIAPTSGGGRWIRLAETDVNALHFGADPTYTNDSTVALQAAINFSYGKTLRIPSGKYKHTGLTIDNTKPIRIIGDGWSDDAQMGTSLWNTSTGDSIAISGADSDKRILISDIALVGNFYSGKGISATTSHKIKLENILITSHKASGVTLTNCWVAGMDDCTVANNGQYGLLVYGQGNNIKINHCAFNNNARSAGGYANVALNGTGGNNLAIVFDSCDIEGGGMNPYSTMDSAYNMVVQGTNALSIRGCYFERAYTGLFYADQSLDGFIIDGCYFQDGTVDISGAKNGVFSNNTLQFINTATSVSIDAPNGANVRQYCTTLLNGATASFPSGCYERKEQFGATSPASGTWKVNDVVWNTNVASGSYIGWICTAAGTPGTWRTFGLIS